MEHKRDCIILQYFRHRGKASKSRVVVILDSLILQPIKKKDILKYSTVYLKSLFIILKMKIVDDVINPSFY